ncbi:hypothetical protein E2C01_015965 [Portunus trituberculatus]|uniref:Uncharacterized protein n=1 Tax=Portunus trituberculatus TaxID=210409 RepID=A0A5B7DPP9_PORTR|nr:hypothetical protein [Portunus trituberculatus]
MAEPPAVARYRYAHFKIFTTLTHGDARPWALARLAWTVRSHAMGRGHEGGGEVAHARGSGWVKFRGRPWACGGPGCGGGWADLSTAPPPAIAPSPRPGPGCPADPVGMNQQE